MGLGSKTPQAFVRISPRSAKGRWKTSAPCRQRQGGMNDDDRQECKNHVEAQLAESEPGILGPNDAIPISVPIQAMLLHHRLHMWYPVSNRPNEWPGTHVFVIMVGVLFRPVGLLKARCARSPRYIGVVYPSFCVRPGRVLLSFRNTGSHVRRIRPERGSTVITFIVDRFCHRPTALGRREGCG